MKPSQRARIVLTVFLAFVLAAAWSPGVPRAQSGSPRQQPGAAGAPAAQQRPASGLPSEMPATFAPATSSFDYARREAMIKIV